MPEFELVPEFDGLDREQHNTANARLGLDPKSGKRDRPGLLRLQAPAAKPATEVFDAWETPGAYEQLIHQQLEQATTKAAIAASAHAEPHTPSRSIRPPTSRLALERH